MKKIVSLIFVLLIVCFVVGCNNNQNDPKIDEPVEHVHDYELIEGKPSTCTEYGYSDYYQCKSCKEIVDKRENFELAPHEYEFIKEEEATKDSVGYRVYKCKNCSEELIKYNNALNKEDKEMEKINILLVGNSLTNYNTLMKCFNNMANSEGYDVVVDKCAYGSQYLYDYLQGPDGDYFDSFFSIFFGKRYNLVILQDGEENIMLNEANSYDSFRKMTSYIKKFGAKGFIYETYQKAKGLREIGLNYEETTYITDAKTKAIASELEIGYSPVAIAFLKVIQDKKDIVLYNSDGVHPSSFGTYLTALVHEASVFGKRLDGVKYTYNDYIKDKSITWHCENELIEIDEETQKYLESVANYACFDFVLDSKYERSSIGISEKEGTHCGFMDTIEVDNETNGEINLSYKQTSGVWKVTDNNTFINTSGEAVLMFQKDLLLASEKNEEEENVLSFDICVKEELVDCTYVRGIILGSINKDMKYFDGTDALILGRYAWSERAHLEAMRVWDPTLFPSYNYKSGYTFDCGFYFKDLGRDVMEVGKTYHVQITIDAKNQRYGYYVNGALYGFVLGYDLPKGGYFGIMSYEASKIEYSNFKFNGKKLVFN